MDKDFNFNPEGILQILERYYNGEMSHEERHALEKAALADPLLQLSMEGYEALIEDGLEDSLQAGDEKENNGGGDTHLENNSLRIVPMEKNEEREETGFEKKTNTSENSFFKTLRWKAGAAAACLMIVFGSEYYFKRVNTSLAVAKNDSNTTLPVGVKPSRLEDGTMASTILLGDSYISSKKQENFQKAKKPQIISRKKIIDFQTFRYDGDYAAMGQIQTPVELKENINVLTVFLTEPFRYTSIIRNKTLIEQPIFKERTNEEINQINGVLNWKPIYSGWSEVVQNQYGFQPVHSIAENFIQKKPGAGAELDKSFKFQVTPDSTAFVTAAFTSGIDTDSAKAKAMFPFNRAIKLCLNQNTLPLINSQSIKFKILRPNF